MNTAAEAMFGYRAAEVEGKPISILMRERHRRQNHTGWGRWRTSDGQYIAAGRHQKWVGLRKSGDEFPVALSITSWRERSAEQVTVIVQDLSREQATEGELRLLESAIKATTQVTVVTDIESRIQWVNPAFTDVTGYSYQEALGRKMSLLKSGEQDPAFYADLWMTILGGKIWRGSLVNRRKNGTVYNARQVIAPVRDHFGEITHFISVNEDVTGDTRLRNMLKKTSERYRRLFENSPLALWEEDFSQVKTYLDDLRASGVQDLRAYFAAHHDAIIRCASLIRIVDVNAAAVRMTGAHGKAQLLGDLRAVFDEDSYSNLADQLAWLSDGHLTYQSNVVNRSFSGDTLYVDLKLNIAPEFAATWSEVIVSIEDISKRRQREKQLEHATKMEAVGQLTGGIAHDFNNVLTVISGNLRLMTEMAGSKYTGDMGEMLADALSAADDGAALTSRLLAFSRPPAAVIKLQDINRLIEDFTLLTSRSLGPGIEVVTRLATDLPQALTDANVLANALLNLSLNARDAMPNGGRLTLETGSGDIELTGTPKSNPVDCVIIEISDTGCGMSADILAKATEPFFTTKALEDGTGLGLSMAYEFTRDFGGDLRISSTPGVGTTVALYLPLEPAGKRGA